MNHQDYMILIDTPDEPGLIYKITKVIYESNLNIVYNSEFVDKSDNHFFMRTEVKGAVNPSSLLAELKSVLPERSHVRISRKEKKKVVLLVTKEHHCLGDLLIRNEFQELEIEILGVISNYETLGPLTERFNIPYTCISHENLSREAHEAQMIAAIQRFDPEYIILAKYMRILSPEFVAQYPNQIINIHHSFLPAFIGANPYKQAYERGVKIIGATSHFVNNDLDEGPIIVQEVIPTDHSYSVDAMRQAGRDAEKLALSKAIQLVTEERIFIRKNKTIILG